MSEDNPGVKTNFLEPHNIEGMNNKNIKYESLKSGDNCMIAGGRCIKHDISVVRGISLRRKSVVSKDGDVNWKKCDFVSLACPVAQQLNVTDVLAPNTALSGDECEGTNKRGRKYSRREDQSASKDLSEERRTT